MGRRSKENPLDWQRAKELAERGCWESEAARIMGIHHTTALYIARKMGFEWAPSPRRSGFCGEEFRRLRRKKPVSINRPLPKTVGGSERIERMLDLARRLG
jgi:hypothetical protein